MHLTNLKISVTIFHDMNSRVRRQRMRKMIKKASVILSGVILTGALAACAKFDASDYVKAILDNAYYNDANKVFVQLILMTEKYC